MDKERVWSCRRSAAGLRSSRGLTNYLEHLFRFYETKGGSHQTRMRLISKAEAQSMP